MGNNLSLVAEKPQQLKTDIRYHTLLQNTRRAFSIKGLRKDLSEGIFKFISHTHSSLIYAHKDAEAEQFLDKIQEITNAVESMKDVMHLIAISHTIEHWIKNIEHIYHANLEKASDLETAKERENARLEANKIYLDGQNKFFKALYSYLTSSYVKDLYLEKTKENLVSILSKNDTNQAA